MNNYIKELNQYNLLVKQKNLSIHEEIFLAAQDLRRRRLTVHEPQGLTTIDENLRMAGTEARPTVIFM